MEDKQERRTIKKIFELANKTPRGSYYTHYDGYSLVITNTKPTKSSQEGRVVIGDYIAYIPSSSDDSKLDEPYENAIANYIECIPDMEYYLRQLVELLPEIQNQLYCEVGVIANYVIALDKEDYIRIKMVDGIKGEMKKAGALCQKLKTLIEEMGIDE